MFKRITAPFDGVRAGHRSGPGGYNVTGLVFEGNIATVTCDATIVIEAVEGANTVASIGEYGFSGSSNLVQMTFTGDASLRTDKPVTEKPDLTFWDHSSKV